MAHACIHRVFFIHALDLRLPLIFEVINGCNESLGGALELFRRRGVFKGLYLELHLRCQRMRDLVPRENHVRTREQLSEEA